MKMKILTALLVGMALFTPLAAFAANCCPGPCCASAAPCCK